MTSLGFASWAQPAAGAAEADVDPADGQPDNPPDPPPRASLAPVAVIKNTLSGDTREAGGVPRIDVLGPESVAGLEPGQIIGRFPVPGSTGSEAINLAAVEFNSTDLPWRFSPARAGDQQRLRPWLVLIVVPDSVGITAGTPLPTMSVPVPHLPDLAESWAWAHVQLDGNAAGMGRSRLLCPRKLPPDSTLQAAVVPAFFGGVQTGLGQPVDPATAHAPAWTITQATDAVLPVYDYWQFSTGKDADFEFLARRIRPARREDLGDFGYRSIDINHAWPDEELSAAPAVIALGGALRPLGAAPPGANDEQLSTFYTRISNLINDTADGALGPPLRGGQHSKRTKISPINGDWVDEVNRDPARRMAAARGADWVQANQEELMAQAWTQAGQIREAAKRLAMSRAAVAITESLHGRHVAALTTDELVALTAPVAARARIGGAADQPTLQAALGASAAPIGVATTAMARLVRPTGVVGRATQARAVMSRAVSGALTQTITTGYSVSKLAAVAQAQPAQPVADNPLADFVTATDIDTAAVAATSMWVASKVAQSQGVNIATTFTSDLDGQPSFIDGPQSVAAKLAPVAVRTKVAQAISRDQLTEKVMDAPAVTVAMHPDGLQLAPEATSDLVKGAFDSAAAVRRRLASNIVRGNTQLVELDPVLPTPDVPIPMSRAMLDRGPEWFLPGIGKFPQDRANLLTTDNKFVESVMLAANFELLSEFLWREFPTDRRGTPIARFWPRPDAATDINPIHTWTGPLGSNCDIKDENTTVLLIRAELFVRYPNTVVLAAKAELDPHHPNQLRPVASLDDWRKPLFTVKIDSSTRAIGFPVSQADVGARVAPTAPGWFFVLVEPPTSIRFGFDLRNDPPTPPTDGDPPAPPAWNDLTWDHVIDARGFANARNVVVLNPPMPPPEAQWGGPAACAADVARIALQHPVRVALHASTMIPTAE
jgi:hypothetical protein